MFDSDDEYDSPEEQEDTLHSTLHRYEEMIRTRQNYFFDVDALIRIVDHYIEKSDFSKASEVAEFGSELHPYSVNFLIKKAQLSALGGRFDAALALLDEAERISPNDTDACIIRGNVYSTIERYQDAITCFNKALQHSEFRDDIFLGMGITYQNMHEYELARTYFIRAIEENPHYEAAYEHLCLCFAHTDQIEDGIRYFNSLIDRDPYSWLAWYNLGDLYAKLSLFEKALAAFDYCLIIKEDFLPAYLDSANVLGRLGNYRASIDRIRQSFEFSVPDAYTYYTLAECYEKLDEIHEARLYYKKSAKLQPDFPEAWYGIAITLEAEERWNEMLHYARKALSLEKDNSDYLLLVADALHNLPDQTGAEDHYKRALAADPENTDAWLGYLAFLENTNRGDEALALNEKAVGLHADCPELFYRLVCNLYLQGHQKESYVRLQEALQLNASGSEVIFELVPALRHDQQIVEILARYRS